MTSSIRIQNNKLDNTVNKTKTIYKVTMALIHIIYIFLFFGILTIDFKYLRLFSIFIQILVCIFLIIRFHPFREHYYEKNDATILFGSAIFMLENLGLTELALYYGRKLEDNVSFLGKLHKDITSLFSRNKKETENGKVKQPTPETLPYQ